MKKEPKIFSLFLTLLKIQKNLKTKIILILRITMIMKQTNT